MRPRFDYNEAQYKTATSCRREYQISSATLRKWADTNVIRSVRFGNSGKRLYHFVDIQNHIGITNENDDKKESIIYARVSSAHQKEDLQRQIEDLKTAYPNHRVVSDVGSGINFHRKGLNSILDQCIAGNIAEIVVMHKDRLARFATELLELIFKKTGVKLLVHSKSCQPETRSETQELAEDLLAITTVFVAKHNGRRSAINRKRRRDVSEGGEAKEGKGESCSKKRKEDRKATAGDEGTQDSVVPSRRDQKDASELARGCQVDL